MSIMSVVACLRKSSSVTFGNEISAGKKVTVSTSLSYLIVGKYHFIHLECSGEQPIDHPPLLFNSHVCLLDGLE